jgi:four helix bundle protein
LASKSSNQELPSVPTTGKQAGHRSKAEFIAKIGDCLKEANETLYWLEVISDSKTISVKRLQPLIRETDELLAILTTIHKKAKKR